MSKRIAMLGSNVIFKATNNGKTEYYLYSKGTKTKIDNYDPYSSGKQYYVTKEYLSASNTYKYTYYNEDGNVILQLASVSSSRVVYTYDNNGGIIVQAISGGKTNYYKITK